MVKAAREKGLIANAQAGSKSDLAQRAGAVSSLLGMDLMRLRAEVAQRETMIM